MINVAKINELTFLLLRHIVEYFFHTLILSNTLTPPLLDVFILVSLIEIILKVFKGKIRIFEFFFDYFISFQTFQKFSKIFKKFFTRLKIHLIEMFMHFVNQIFLYFVHSLVIKTEFINSINFTKLIHDVFSVETILDLIFMFPNLILINTLKVFFFINIIMLFDGFVKKSDTSRNIFSFIKILSIHDLIIFRRIPKFLRINC